MSDALTRFAQARSNKAAATQVAAAPPRAIPTNRARGVAQNLGQGLSFGMTDELAAGIVALLSQLGASGREQGIGNVYDETLEQERASMARNSEALGTGGVIASQLAGGLVTGGAVGSALGRAAASRLAAASPAIARTIAAASTPVGQGALEGGIAGFGASEGGLGNRAVGAAKGAAAGAATAGTITGAGRAVGARFAEDVASAPTVQGRTLGEMADTLKVKVSPAVRSGDAAGAMGESALQRSPVTRSMFNKDIAHNKVRPAQIILDRFGLKGSKVDGVALNEIKTGINKQYDDIGRDMADAISLAPVDVEQRTAMNEILNEVRESVGDMAKKGRLKDALRRVDNAMDGTKNKTVVMDTINFLRKRSRAAYKNAEIADGEALTQLEEVITMAAMDADPAIARRLNTARKAWRDYKIVSAPSVTKVATGRVNPVTMAGLLNRSKFTREVFGSADEVGNGVLDLGRFVQQLEDAGGDPGLIFGAPRTSKTAEALGFNPLNVAGSLIAGGAHGLGRLAGPQATTAAATGARQVFPRLSGIGVSER